MSLSRLLPAHVSGVADNRPSLFQQYVVALQTRPLETKSVTAGVLQGVQELVAQQVAGGKVDLWRVLKMTAYGLLISGPLGHFLYSALAEYFKGQSGLLVTLSQLLIANLIFSPIQNAIYIAAMALINGKSVPETVQAVRHGLLPMLKVTWVMFPVVQAIAAKFLEPPLWTPFFNAVGFVFGLYFNIRTKLSGKKA